MDQGKIIVEGTPKVLVQKYMGPSVIEVSSEKEGVEPYLKAKGLDYEKYRRIFLYSWPEFDAFVA